MRRVVLVGLATAALAALAGISFGTVAQEPLRLASAGAPEPSVDIRDYGAATTASDNYPAIQAALDNAASNRGTVIIPQGTFTFRSMLRVPPGVTLAGLGHGSSILKREDPGRGFSVANDTTLRDFGLIGQSAPGSIANSCASFDNAIDSGSTSGVRIERLSIQNWACYAIILPVGTRRWVMADNYILNTGDGINLTHEASDHLVSGNWIEANALNGIDINGDRNRITSNYLVNNGRAQQGSDNSGILIFTKGVGQHADANIITNNIVSGNWGAGIMVNASSGAVASRNVVVGNSVSDTGHEGIRLQGSTHTVVSGNVVSNSGTYAVALVDASTQDSVSGNQMLNSKTAGLIVVSHAVVEPYIEGNLIGPSPGRGVWLVGGTRVQLRDNWIHDNVGAAYSDSGIDTVTDGGAAATATRTPTPTATATALPATPTVAPTIAPAAKPTSTCFVRVRDVNTERWVRQPTNVICRP